MRPSRPLITVLSLAGAVALAGCGGSSTAASGAASGSTTPAGAASPASAAKSSAPRTLVGYFRLTAGHCGSATSAPTGSYLAMLGAGGNGFVKNPTGGCLNPDYSPLTPGTDGGLVTGAYQPGPSPAFDAKGDSLAQKIFHPVTFFGTAFGGATAAVDAQTSAHVPPPSITDTGGHLTANLEAFDVAYNNSYFNQGSPKPTGGYVGTTTAATGSISCSGAFTLTWRSLIQGGAFNNFTGQWTLAGTFQPAAGSLASALGC